MSLTVLALSLAAAAQPAPYRALGTEPFWSLTIDGSTIRYRPAEGRGISVAKPRALNGRNGTRYQTPRLSVLIAHTPCSDGMSDRRYRNTVTLRIGGTVRKGCGGAILSQSGGPTLLEGEWTVSAIDRRPVLRGTEPHIAFSGTRVQGQTGCNSFSGGFDFARGHLQARPLATTRRGCIGEGLAAQEQRLLAILGQPLSVSRSQSGALVMTAPNRSRLTLVPRR
ncbi:META domain-containing protein [Sphingomonas sp. S2-65]|uniref:META domain-containing protein n=1 Tax=Sphingomonas sp. S2-65 TaxID=2903960 RepID=UPI001F3A6EF2|nr:META domain-containing protein [Sphingomonas sp. S2-65]UYY59120.1 META domain-containing protein [Sphingomonas sp. S2-65]